MYRRYYDEKFNMLASGFFVNALQLCFLSFVIKKTKNKKTIKQQQKTKTKKR